MSPFGPLHDNVTSSTKPEVRNLSQRHQRRTEPRPRATSAENLVKFGHVVLEIFEWTVRQTHTLTYRQTRSITILRFPTGGGVMSVTGPCRGFYVSWQRGTARICCCAPCCGGLLLSIGQSIDSISSARQQRSAASEWDRQTDRRMDTVPLYRPCCPCHAGSNSNIYIAPLSPKTQKRRRLNVPSTPPTFCWRITESNVRWQNTLQNADGRCRSREGIFRPTVQSSGTL